MSINTLINQSTFSDEDKRKLIKYKKKVQAVLKYEDYTNEDLFYEACNFVLETIKFEFKDALNVLGGLDAKEFYDTQWFSEVELKDENDKPFKIALNELFHFCSCQEFYDLDGDCSALDFINGDNSATDTKALLSLYKPRITGEIILSAEEVREKQYWTRMNNEWERLRDIAFRLLDVSVFNGVFSCNVFTTFIEQKDINFLIEQFNAIGFSVQCVEDDDGDGTNLVVMAQQSTGDFNAKYSEDQLLRMLESKRQGDAYFFVATYCDKKIIPGIVGKCYEELAERLSNIDSESRMITMTKVKTKTCAYAQVFITLRAKGFKVYDSEKEFRVEW